MQRPEMTYDPTVRVKNDVVKATQREMAHFYFWQSLKRHTMYSLGACLKIRERIS
jgi:hypothetical protein